MLLGGRFCIVTGTHDGVGRARDVIRARDVKKIKKKFRFKPGKGSRKMGRSAEAKQTSNLQENQIDDLRASNPCQHSSY